MSSTNVRLVTLLSVVLTKEKQKVAQREFERYASAVNFVIKAALAKHVTSSKRLVEAIEEEFLMRFDDRTEYMKDVVRTAAATIVRHRKMTRVIPARRDRAPYFRSGSIVLSPPLIAVNETGLVLMYSKSESMPVPFDKRSRNKEATLLQDIVHRRTSLGRTRLIWHKEGFLEFTFRVRSGGPVPGSQ
jgi:hypothetical protein